MGSDSNYKEKYENIKKQFEIFSYGVSHDLSAPLRHVREFTKILLDSLGDEVTEDQKEAIYFITEGVKTSEIMVEGLLTYSRLNTLQKSFSSFNAEHLFTYAQAGCQEIIKERDAKIYLPEKNLDIIGDLEQLHNLVSFLIDNAVKFCYEDKQPEVHINIEDKGENYILSVKDNGIGIKEKRFEEIFNIFKQLDPESPGVGLGLALAQKIADRHNGHIWLESELGKGSIFYFSFPKNPGED